MADDAQAPATKGDLAGVKADLAGVKADITGVKADIAALDRKIEAIKEELKLYFDVAVENIRSDLQGANRDEIELMKDTDRKHGQRITRLEQRAGVAA